MPQTRLVTLRVSPEEFAQWSTAAREEGRTLSAWIRRTLGVSAGETPPCAAASASATPQDAKAPTKPMNINLLLLQRDDD